MKSRYTGEVDVKTQVGTIRLFVSEDGKRAVVNSDLRLDVDHKDILESLVMAQALAGFDVRSPEYVESLDTMLDGIANNMENRTIAVPLTIYDEDGDQADSDYVELPESCVLDVVAQAIRVCEAHRKEDPEERELSLGELDECLTSYSLVDDKD